MVEAHPTCCRKHSLFKFGFLFCVSVSLSTAEATWELGKLEANQGDDVTITCTADNIDMFTPVRIEKRVSILIMRPLPI